MVRSLWFLALAAGAILAPVAAIAADDLLKQQMDDPEIKEVEKRIQQFYHKSQSPEAMSQVPPKYSPEKKQFITPNTLLKLKEETPEIKAATGETKKLLQQAQIKGTDRFQKHQCKTFIDKKFPKLGCKNPEGRASAEGNDQVSDLTATWIDEDDVKYALDDIKTSGKSKLALWSDDYWRIKFGITSYRYSEAKHFAKFKEAVESYAQPQEWAGIVGKLGAAQLTKQVNGWSPSEKYDLTVGDERFTLTNQQKGEGWSVAVKDDVEDWMGICHGWAPAAFIVPKADKPVKVVGAQGLKMTWYPNDIRAMASLAWANGSTETNFIGGRCDVKKAKTQKNGRLSDPDCFDNNPSTFHLALANLIGEEKLSFVMDKTFDYEVWNQPVASYDFTYFNPLDPTKRSKKWETVAVDYDDTFKATDRFQKPLTRGVRSGNKYNDREVKQVVGVIATVSYLEEVDPTAGPKATPNSVARVTYTYDLELHEKGGKFVALGGEWHENTHPDFLWMPTKGTVALETYDKVRLTFDGTEPSETVTKTAKQASGDGYPLCTVLSYLVEESSGGKKYSCK